MIKFKILILIISVYWLVGCTHTSPMAVSMGYNKAPKEKELTHNQFTKIIDYRDYKIKRFEGKLNEESDLQIHLYSVTNNSIFNIYFGQHGENQYINFTNEGYDYFKLNGLINLYLLNLKYNKLWSIEERDKLLKNDLDSYKEYLTGNPNSSKEFTFFEQTRMVRYNLFKDYLKVTVTNLEDYDKEQEKIQRDILNLVYKYSPTMRDILEPDVTDEMIKTGKAFMTKKTDFKKNDVIFFNGTPLKQINTDNIFETIMWIYARDLKYTGINIFLGRNEIITIGNRYEILFYIIHEYTHYRQVGIYEEKINKNSYQKNVVFCEQASLMNTFREQYPRLITYKNAFNKNDELGNLIKSSKKNRKNRLIVDYITREEDRYKLSTILAEFQAFKNEYKAHYDFAKNMKHNEFLIEIIRDGNSPYHVLKKGILTTFINLKQKSPLYYELMINNYEFIDEYNQIDDEFNDVISKLYKKNLTRYKDVPQFLKSYDEYIFPFLNSPEYKEMEAILKNRKNPNIRTTNIRTYEKGLAKMMDYNEMSAKYAPGLIDYGTKEYKESNYSVPTKEQYLEAINKAFDIAVKTQRISYEYSSFKEYADLILKYEKENNIKLKYEKDE